MLLLRHRLRALRLLMGLRCALLRLLRTFLLFWLLCTFLLPWLLRALLWLRLRRLCMLRCWPSAFWLLLGLRCVLLPLWLLLGLRCVLLPLGLLSVLLLLYWLSARLLLFPLLLFLFLIVLGVSRDDQSRKQADCCGAGYTRAFHVKNSYRGMIQARRVPSWCRILTRREGIWSMPCITFTIAMSCTASTTRKKALSDTL